MKRKIVKASSALRIKLERKILGIAYRIQNTGNGNFKENGELNFIRNLSFIYADKDFVFFDIGANKGEYTDLITDNMKCRAISAHIFEPQKTCFKSLESKPWARKGFILNNFGLSDENRETLLFKDFDQSGLASLNKRNLDHYGIKMDLTEKISLKKASEYIERNKISNINLIKIDVEGHEIPALTGFGDFLNGTIVDFVQFEYGGSNLDSHTSLMELFTFFTARGFTVCKMMKNGLEMREYGPELENFTYQNYVAVSSKFLKAQNLIQ